MPEENTPTDSPDSFAADSSFDTAQYESNSPDLDALEESAVVDTADTIQPPAGPLANSLAFQKWGLVGLLLFFTAFAFEFVRTDLWFDELLTLSHFVSLPQLSQVFEHYPIANNHMLFSGLLWTWWRIVRFVISEEVLRFPCLLLALLSISILFLHGRRLFGAGGGYLMALMLAFSPVYLGFFYQLRGYGLSIFLAILATLGVFYIIKDRLGQGTFFYVVGTVLLPIVVPSNLMLNASLFVFLNLVCVQNGMWRRRLPLLVMLGVASVAGMIVYQPIWPQFRSVMTNTGGWSSGVDVVLHWGLALLSHVLLFIVSCLWMRRSPGIPDHVDKYSDLRRTLPLLALCCIVPIISVALWRAPFPRAFIAYLVPFTFCALFFLRPAYCRVDKYFLLLIFFILANGVVWYRLADYFTRKSLYEDGQFRQNLVQQFYTRNQDIYDTTRALAQSSVFGSRTQIFIEFHQYLSFQHYWSRVGGRVEQVECMLGGSDFFGLQHPAEMYRYYPQFIIGYDPEQARAAYEKTLGYEVQLQEIYIAAPMRLFRVIPTTPPPRPKPRRPHDEPV